MKRRTKFLPLLGALAASSEGCATIMHGSHQDVSISSTPTGASITVDGQERGKTPIVVDLRRKEKALIKLTLDGYLPFETYLTKKTSGWVVGNLIFGAIPGLIVDALTGGIYLLRPEEIAPVLVRAGAADSGAEAGTRMQGKERTVEPVTPPPRASPDPSVGGDPGSVRLRSSRIRIVTEPVGAEVLLGGTSLGNVTLAGLVVDLPNGESVFRVEMAGYDSVEKRVWVDEQIGSGGVEAIVVVVRLVQRDARPEPPEAARGRVVRSGTPTEARSDVSAAMLPELLQSEDRRVREKAVSSLGRPGPHAKESVLALINALRDRSWQVRLSAAEALGRIGPDANLAVPALLETTRDNHLATSIKASRAIEKIGPSALPALTEAAKSSDPKIRKEAANLATKILERQAH